MSALMHEVTAASEHALGDSAPTDIALALDSTPEAARQAASSGVRRLRANARTPGRIHDRLA